MYINENTVLSCTGIVLWDGITTPEPTADGTGLKYSLVVMIPTSAPEHAELKALADKELNAGPFKGVLPPNAYMPLATIDFSKFTDPADAQRVQGHERVKTRTYKTPYVVDANGQQLEPLQYAKQLYAGAEVRVLVSPGTSNEGKSKAVVFNLEGVQLLGTQAPQLSIGGGLSATEKANAFAQPMAQQPAPALQQPASQGIQPAPEMVNQALGAPPADLHVMTAAAKGTYEAYITAGWSDDQLKAQGLMQ